ncbi:hypothetical protein BAE44_0025915, partial [Dichanthelium oligosanthes]
TWIPASKNSDICCSLLNVVSESAAVIRNLAVDAFSPAYHPDIPSINLDLLNIETVATELEQRAFQYEEALHSQNLLQSFPFIVKQLALILLQVSVLPVYIASLHLSGSSRDREPFHSRVCQQDFAARVRVSNTPVEPPARKPSGKQDATKGKMPNFTVSEDNTLVSCWLNVSLDATVGKKIGNGQRKPSFWKRVHDNYNAQKGQNYPERTQRSLDGRWKDIKLMVSKFEGYFNKVVRENRSGYTDSDNITEALNLYKNLETKTFTVLHCWEALRDQPKWTDLNDKGQHGDDSSAPIDLEDSAPIEVDSSSVAGTKRPMGRDSTKAAKRASLGQSGSQSVAQEFSMLLSNIHVEKVALLKDADDEVSKHLGNLVDVQREKIGLEKAREARQQREEEARIMALDLDTCTPT